MTRDALAAFRSSISCIHFLKWGNLQTSRFEEELVPSLTAVKLTLEQRFLLRPFKRTSFLNLVNLEDENEEKEEEMDFLSSKEYGVPFERKASSFLTLSGNVSEGGMPSLGSYTW